MNLVIIIPTFNERDNIIVLLEKLRDALREIRGYAIQYLVVDDNSPDGTKDLVAAYKKKHTDVFILTGKKEGLGKALLRGLSFAVDSMHADVLLQLDADLSHDPKVTPKFIDAIARGYDFVVGSRYIPGGSIPANWGLHRKIQSVVGNSIVRFGLSHPEIHDWTGGFRAFKKKHFERLRQELVDYRGYVFQIAFLHKAVRNGANVYEVPIHFTDRKYGRSKIIPSEYIRNVFLYIFRAYKESPRVRKWIKFLMVGGWGFIVNTIVLELLVWIGFHPAASSAIGAECAIISNFILNNHWTFRDRKIKKANRFIKFLQFNMTSLGAIAIQAGIVYFGTHFTGIDTYRGYYLLGVGTAMFWNYFMYSRVIWPKE